MGFAFFFAYLKTSEILLPFSFLFLNSTSWDVKRDDDKRAHLYHHLCSSHVKERRKSEGKGKGFIFFEPHRVCICLHTLLRALFRTRETTTKLQIESIGPPPPLSLSSHLMPG